MTFPQYERYKDSGVQWLGNVPGHWEIQRLRRLFEIKKRIVGTLGFGVLSITQQGLKIKDTESNDGQISMDYSKYQLVEPGDFAMNHMDLLTGYVDISRVRGVTSPDYRVFTIRNSNQCFDRYYLYLLQTCYDSKIFYAFGQGASQLGRWRMPTDQFKDFVFPLPPFREQLQIAAFLDKEAAKIDTLVEEQRRLIDLLKEKRQGIISNVIAKGLKQNAPMRRSEIEWLGEIPQHWAIRKLGHLAFMQEGPGLRHWQFTESGTRVICVTNITDSGIDFSRLAKFISNEEYETSYQHFTVDPGDLLLSSSGNSWGKVASYLDDEKVILNTSTIRLHEADTKPLIAAYLYWLLNSACVKEQLGLAMTGACQPNFGPTHLREVMVPVPLRDEQSRIAAFLNYETIKFNDLIAEANESIALLQERRSALISAAVTGKIDVRGLVHSKAEAA